MNDEVETSKKTIFILLCLTQHGFILAIFFPFTIVGSMLTAIYLNLIFMAVFFSLLPLRPFLLLIALLSKKNYLFIASGAILDEWIVGWIYCVHRITAKLIRESLSKRCNKTSRQADFTCDFLLLFFLRRCTHLRCHSPLAFNTHSFFLHLSFSLSAIAAHLCNFTTVSILHSDTWTKRWAIL